MAPRSNYSLEFKTKVAERALAIGNWRQAGLEYGVDEANVRRWIKLLNRSSEATLNNPIARPRRVPRSTARTPRVPRSTVRTPRARPRFPAIDTQVLDFIHRMRSNEDAFTFTRAIICEEALRISREIGITEFTGSHGWYQKFMR